MSGGDHYESKSDSIFHILVPVFDLKCHIFYISISIFSASAGSVRYDFNYGEYVYLKLGEQPLFFTN